MCKELSFDVWVALTKCKWIAHNWPSRWQGQKSRPFFRLYFCLPDFRPIFCYMKWRANWIYGTKIKFVCGKEEFLALSDLVELLNGPLSLLNPCCPGYAKVTNWLINWLELISDYFNESEIARRSILTFKMLRMDQYYSSYDLFPVLNQMPLVSILRRSVYTYWMIIRIIIITHFHCLKFSSFPFWMQSSFPITLTVLASWPQRDFFIYKYNSWHQIKLPPAFVILRHIQIFSTQP